MSPKNYGSKKILGPKTSWVQKIFGFIDILGKRKFLFKKYFGSKKLFGPKLLDTKWFWPTIFYGSKQILGPKILWTERLWVKENLGPNQLGPAKDLFSVNFVLVLIFSKHLQYTFETPSEYLLDNFETPSKRLRDTYQTTSRHHHTFTHDKLHSLTKKPS